MSSAGMLAASAPSASSARAATLSRASAEAMAGSADRGEIVVRRGVRVAP